MRSLEQGVVTAFVDQVARDKAAAAQADAQRALDEMSSHENLCAERYGNINSALRTIKNILGWAGSTIFGLLTVTLGWLIVQQVNHNDSDKDLLRAQIEMLQRQSGPVVPSPGSTAR